MDSGAASGGSWSNAANWEAHSSKGYGVEELFHRYTVYDFRNLAPGAVVTMDYEDGNAYNPRDSTGNTFVYGMVFSGNPGDTWTLAKGTDKRIRFTSPSYMDITGGTLDFHRRRSSLARATPIRVRPFTSAVRARCGGAIQTPTSGNPVLGWTPAPWS